MQKSEENMKNNFPFNFEVLGEQIIFDKSIHSLMFKNPGG